MHACAGLPDCFTDKWRQMHPDNRFLMREASLARAQGADPEQAMRIAKAKLAERDALQAKFDASKAAQAAQKPERATPPQPRIRRL
jgi:hypothetical protein